MTDAAAVSARLKDAIGSGEILTICYHGGSQPGARRKVEPLAMVGVDKIRMKCRTSGAAKVFSIAKVEILDDEAPDSSGVADWSLAPPTAATPPTLAEIEAMYRSGLEAIGWHVVREGEPDDEALCLYRRTKAGKLLKHPTLMLRYETTAWDLVAMEDGSTVRANFRPRSRPWSVRSRAGGLGTWGSPAKALTAFLREAATYP